MKILHVIDSVNPRMGGLPRVAVSLACALAETPQTQCGLLFYEREADETELTWRDTPGWERVQRLPLPLPEGLEWLRGKRLREQIRAFRPALVQVHGLWEPMLHQACREAAALKIPFVVTPHSMLHPWQRQHHRPAKWILQEIWGLNRLWRQAAWMHAVSEAEAATLRSLGFDRVRVFANGVFAGEDPEPCGDWLRGLHRPTLLFLGRLDAVKGCRELLTAFRELSEAFPACDLIFAGPDYGQQDMLFAQAQTWGLQQRVLFPGMLQGREKWAALRQCAVFCLPSLSEGCSLSVLEAGLAGAPIAMSPACDLPEWFSQSLAVPLTGSASEMAETLASLLRDQPRARQMGQRARAEVLAHHGWADIAAALRRAYAETVGGGRSA